METPFTSQQTYVDEFKASDYFKTYYVAEGGIANEEWTDFALRTLHETFTKGGVKGETLIDFGAGPTIYHLLSACEVFDKIITSDYLEQNRAELEKWLKKDPSAFDWTPIIKFVCELEGNRMGFLTVSLDFEPQTLVVTGTQIFSHLHLRYQIPHATGQGHLLGEWIDFALRNLHETFGPGGVKGDILIDFGAGPTIYHLLSACEAFNSIITSDFLEQNREQLEKWLRKDPDALDWSHVVKFVCELEGNSDNLRKKEETLRRKVIKVLKCDAFAEKPYDPVPMPEADCLISCLCLECPCKDLEDFTNALKKLKELLKPGGHIIIQSVLNCSFYYVGNKHFPHLSLSKDDVEKAFKEAGYEIVKLKVLPRSEKAWMNVSDHDSYYLIHALKSQKE